MPAYLAFVVVPGLALAGFLLLASRLGKRFGGKAVVALILVLAAVFVAVRLGIRAQARRMFPQAEAVWQEAGEDLTALLRGETGRRTLRITADNWRDRSADLTPDEQALLRRLFEGEGMALPVLEINDLSFSRRCGFGALLWVEGSWQTGIYFFPEEASPDSGYSKELGDGWWIVGHQGLANPLPR